MLPREERFVEGEPCRKCGGTRRYRRGGQCPPCMRAAGDAWRRRKARGRVPVKLTPAQRRVSRDVLRSLGQDQREVALLESEFFRCNVRVPGDE